MSRASSRKDVPVYLELVGQTVGFQDVEIRARVEGFLETMNFQEGSFVTRATSSTRSIGSRSKPSSPQAKADQATAEARLAKANNDVTRYTPLVAKQAVSKQELDNALAAAGRGAGRRSRPPRPPSRRPRSISSYTRVTSPINGLVGTTLVKPGNLVGRGESTLLTTISQIDPMLFSVGVTEADYLRDRDGATAGNGVRPARARGIQLTLADGTVYPHTGKVNTVDRAVDPTTGTLGIELRLPQSRSSSCGRASTVARACFSTPRQARSSFRSAPCRSCRTSTASPSWTAAARWRFATSRSARAWTRSG